MVHASTKPAGEKMEKKSIQKFNKSKGENLKGVKGNFIWKLRDTLILITLNSNCLKILGFWAFLYFSPPVIFGDF